ncbi:MAG: RES domain-containing protein [Desulfobacteraceae bacterium]|nr:RES domain-containing protein [Desulfobacteraceae bacterium]
MNIASYRIVKNNHIKTALKGEGSKRYGGRWNNKGVSIVYTSDSLALASMEIFAHLPSYKQLNDYIFLSVSFNSNLVLNADIEKRWDDRPASQISKVIGDQWVKENRSVILRVPSVILPSAYNYLININHPDFKKLKIGQLKNLEFDPRLKK